MTPNEWAAFIVAISTLIGSLAIGVRHLVKHYLIELRPNGGTSLRDQVNRLEAVSYTHLTLPTNREV